MGIPLLSTVRELGMGKPELSNKSKLEEGPKDLHLEGIIGHGRGCHCLGQTKG